MSENGRGTQAGWPEPRKPLSAGEHADRVRLRTREEVAWLRVAAERVSERAERLDRQLTAARR